MNPSIVSRLLTVDRSEADLDVEYTIGLATGVPITFLSTAGNEQFSVALANSVSYIAGLESPPTVMTTSYGTNEDQFTPSLLTYAIAWLCTTAFLICGFQ